MWWKFVDYRFVKIIPSIIIFFIGNGLEFINIYLNLLVNQRQFGILKILRFLPHNLTPDYGFEDFQN